MPVDSLLQEVLAELFLSRWIFKEFSQLVKLVARANKIRSMVGRDFAAETASCSETVEGCEETLCCEVADELQVNSLSSQADENANVDLHASCVSCRSRLRFKCSSIIDTGPMEEWRWCDSCFWQLTHELLNQPRMCSATANATLDFLLDYVFHSQWPELHFDVTVGCLSSCMQVQTMNFSDDQLDVATFRHQDLMSLSIADVARVLRSSTNAHDTVFEDRVKRLDR